MPLGERPESTTQLPAHVPTHRRKDHDAATPRTGRELARRRRL